MRVAEDNQALVAFHFGRFLSLFLVCGLIAWLVSLRWKNIRSILLAGAVIAAAAGTVATANTKAANPPSGQAFFPEAQVLEWMSRSRTICMNRDVQSKTCEGVGIVQTATAKQADVTMVVLVAADASSSIKVAMTIRSAVTSRGFCYTVERPEDIAFQFYGSRDTIGIIGPDDQLIPLAPEMGVQAGQLMRMGGMKTGDEVCERYVVHDQKDGQVTALRVVAFLNGSEVKGGSPMTYHFFDEGAQLPLRVMSAS
jgi:hypothetical protein